MITGQDQTIQPTPGDTQLAHVTPSLSSEHVRRRDSLDAVSVQDSPSDGRSAGGTIYSGQNLKKSTLRKGFDPALLDLIVSLYRRKTEASVLHARFCSDVGCVRQ
ncbi:hypothetical protein SUGI_0036540 [Cryptomeria japonica]|nr:hypothetical protein SUGI_0036540 [Cryptomeria japonica]